MKTISDKIQDLYWGLIPYECRPRRLWYKLKCFCWKRYSTVKPRWLSHAWCDRDRLLLYCMFEILCRFLEEEKDNVEWYEHLGKDKDGKEILGFTIDVNGETVNVMDEMLELRRWWIEECLPYSDGEADNAWFSIWEKKVKPYLPDPFWAEIKDKEQKKKCDEGMEEIHNFEKQIEKEITARCIRLLKVRGYMWT